MNEYTDPDFLGLKIYWSPRSNSTVRIVNKLPLWINGDYQFIPLTFSMARGDLPPDESGFAHIAADTAYLLFLISNDWPKSRKQVIPLPLPSFPFISVKIQRGDIYLLQHFFKGEPPPLHTHNDFLYEAVYVSFFSSRFLSKLANNETVSHLPRGKAWKVSPLTSSLTAALFACKELITQANKEESALKKRIEKIIRENDFLHVELEEARNDICRDVWIEENPDALILTLVHRAFHGAWEAFGHPGLLSANPQDVFMQYLYGKRSEKIASTIQKAIQEFPNFSDVIMKSWKRLYLGNPGAATKTFFPNL